MLTRQEGLVLPSIEERREQERPSWWKTPCGTDGAFVVRPNEPVSPTCRGRPMRKRTFPTLLRVRMGEWRLLDRAQIQKLAASAAAGPGAEVPQGAANAPVDSRAAGTPSVASRAAGALAGAVTGVPVAKVPRTAAELDSKGPLPLVFPDESLEEALRWAGDWPVLPVVNRADLGKLEGVLALADILRAFRSAAAE